MNRFARNDAGKRRASLALAVLGAILALLGGLLLYARENIFDSEALVERSEAALSDQRVRLALAQPITEAIIDSGPPTLVNARPLIESVVSGVLGTPPARAALGEGVRALHQKLFERSPDALLLNLADVATVAVGAVEAVSPKVAERIPSQLADARIEITQSVGPIRTVALAEEVRLGGLILPPLAILSLFGSIAIAPDRRRGMVRAAFALAGAGVAGLLALVVGRAIVVAQFEDDLVSDAVAATWDALLGDLRSAFLLMGVLAIVLAAAARFAATQAFDPLAPFLRAGELLRSRPERPALAVLRGLVLTSLGIVLILQPELTLEAVAVFGGAWVLYIGVSELLTILAPPVEASAGRAAPRRFRPGRVMALGAVVALAVVLAVILPRDDGEAPARPPGSPTACNGFAELCDKRIDELTLAATHNSMSAADDPGWFLPNQRHGIERQLDDGIRALLIDTHYGVRRGDGRGFAEVITDLQKEQRPAGRSSPSSASRPWRRPRGWSGSSPSTAARASPSRTSVTSSASSGRPGSTRSLR